MTTTKIKLLLICSTLLITSCVSKKNITYFQNDLVDQSKVSNSYKTVYKPDDLLQINIIGDPTTPRIMMVLHCSSSTIPILQKNGSRQV